MHFETQPNTIHAIMTFLHNSQSAQAGVSSDHPDVPFTSQDASIQPHQALGPTVITSEFGSVSPPLLTCPSGESVPPAPRRRCARWGLTSQCGALRCTHTHPGSCSRPQEARHPPPAETKPRRTGAWRLASPLGRQGPTS